MRARWLVVAMAALLGACGAILGVSGDDSSNPPPGSGDDARADVEYGDSQEGVDGGGPDSAGSDAEADADPILGDAGATDGGRLRVFVSAKPTAGTGLANADNMCLLVAQSATIGGKWVAWLSLAGTSGAAPARFTKAANGPWYLPDRTTLVAVNKAQLSSKALTHAIDQDAHGNVVAATFVWTGTKADGTLDTKNGNCGNWGAAAGAGSSTVGNSGYADFQWTEAAVDPCATSLPIYCFEQP